MRAGRVDHRHLVGELRHARADTAALRGDQGRDRQLHGQPRAAARPRRASGRTAWRPGPIWTPLIPSTMPRGEGRELRRGHAAGPAGQPAELAPVYVLLASRRGQLHLGCAGRGHRRQSDPLSRHDRSPPAVQERHGVHLGQWPTSSWIWAASRLGRRIRAASGVGRRLPPRLRRRGRSCLRDLLFLDAGCCLAESIGCGANLVLLAPTSVRHVHAAGSGARSPMTQRLIAAVRVYQREISPKRKPCCKYSPTCSNYAVEALETHGARRGAWLTARRLLRCRPGAAGGADPVPAAA